MLKKLPKLILVGSPNVGKSMIFNHLTGAYVVVSNYPGTTVDIARGKAVIGGKVYEVIDTPGMYSLSPVTDEERVTFDLLRSEKPELVIHVVDAKNMSRMLAVSLQLLDGGFPVMVVLNIMDEAEKLGIHIYTDLMAELLGVPVVATVAAQDRGMTLLRKAIKNYCPSQGKAFLFSSELENAIHAIESQLVGDYGLHKRLTALLVLQSDGWAEHQVSNEPCYKDIKEITRCISEKSSNGLACRIAMERQRNVDNIVNTVVRYGKNIDVQSRPWVDRITCHPVLGLPVLFLVLYIGLYQFVGRFGAGFLVDFINNLFVQVVNPTVGRWVITHVPWEWFQSLVIGEYGIFSLGIRYAAAIILPIVGTFFIAFAFLEDCGYLPRLAMIVDGFFKYLGLNGRAIIPVTLGLGCGTMAVMVTRTLETNRERIIATFLLALTIPCSAQLGLVLSLLSHNEMALMIWLGYVIMIFFIAGWLSAKITGGGGSPFYMELPPLRRPSFLNIIKKAYYRMTWYFIEVIPVFIGTSVVLWLADRSNILADVIRRLEPFMREIGLPGEAAEALLLGFFRRDYGAAGLYDLASDGRLSDQQLLVAAVTLTLFMPCVAQFAMMIKERGWPVAILMSAVIAIVAFASGWLVNQGVTWLCLL